ncbi:MAG: hypothetical protein SPE49_07960, partial [Campylobacter sp.]|nr:hypothetical protein [Campylobacter sp.]
EDAEISATVANLRTLVGDINAYYTVKGEFGTDPNIAKWKDITNVPLKGANQQASIFGAPEAASLKVGDNDECIRLQLAEKDDKSPAHILIAKNSSATGVCKQVVESDAMQAYFKSTVVGVTKPVGVGAVTIGSSTTVYTAPTTQGTEEGLGSQP